jgi:hypothetical protein
MEFYKRSLKGSGLKNRNFRGFFPSKKVLKKHFGTAVAKTAA